jgi:hypothetical protein
MLSIMLSIIITFVLFVTYYMFAKFLLQTNTVEITEQKEYVLVISYIFLMFLSLLPINSMTDLMREYNLM